MSRRIPALLLTAAVLVAGISLGAAPSAMAAESATFKTTSVSRDGMTMLPFIETMENEGYTVYSSAQGLYAERGGSWAWAPLYDMYAVVNGETVRLSRAPVIVQGVAYYPEDFFNKVVWGWYDWEPEWPNYPNQGWSRIIEGLRFRLIYDEGAPGKIGLAVKNAASYRKTIEIPSGKTHEIVLKKNGSKVWNSTDGKVFTQAVQYLTLRAGESKTYWTDLPSLARGSYDVEAYFSGVSYKGAVARTRITIRTPYNPPSYGWSSLRYSLSFSQGLANRLNPPQLVLRVNNPSGRDVVFPSGYTYEFVVWGNDGSETRKTLPVSADELGRKVSPGASQTHFVYLNGLKRGSYYAEAYIKSGGQIVRTIGSLNFTVK